MSEDQELMRYYYEGLALATDEDLIPKPTEADLESMSNEEVLRLVPLGDCREENAIKIRKGWVYIMIRRKVGHGNFKKYLDKHNVNYFKAWESLCYAIVAARHPALAGVVTGRAIRQVIRLPESEINKIEEQITGIPAKEAAQIALKWIEKEFDRIQKEKRARARPRKPRPKIEGES